MSDMKSGDYYDDKDRMQDDDEGDAQKTSLDLHVPKSPDSEKIDPSACEEEQEEEILRKKYGGLKPKRPPLIAKDQAFFDSADWALGKQGGQKSKGPLVALRPKLQPSTHHHVRSSPSTYALEAGDGEDHSAGHEDSNDSCTLSDKDQSRNVCSDDVHPDNQSHSDEPKLSEAQVYVYTTTDVPLQE